MTQMLLFPDPRPLVERLGPEFFRQAPEGPGVYLMWDRAQTVLYVGKAKNLRKRLGSYRVANPDRLARRHLRLLRAVDRIEMRPCADEASALSTESMLLRTLRPKFNRAGTWPGTPRYLAWQMTGEGLELAVTQNPQSDWRHFGPLGVTAVLLRAALARMIWCAVFPETGTAGLPEGWFGGRHRESCSIPNKDQMRSSLQQAAEGLDEFFAGKADGFTGWILKRTDAWCHPFDLSVRAADLETLTEFAGRTFRAVS